MDKELKLLKAAIRREADKLICESHPRVFVRWGMGIMNGWRSWWLRRFWLYEKVLW